MINPAAEEQPLPTPGKRSVTDRVIMDLEARRKMGIEKYGTELQTENGRDALLDAYQESLDKTLYLAQALMEKGVL